MQTHTRRYDIDWIRIIAIGLLLLYHTAISFQSWGIMIGFIANDKSWGSLWIPMMMLNVWRIPLLFFVSGMGVYFSIQNRSWRQLLQERATRILLPFLFGMFFIVPVSTLLWQYYYHWKMEYNGSAGHLWFLGNIMAYVVVLSPLLFYMSKNQRLVAWLKKMLGTPLGLLPVVAAFATEAILVNPVPYELYAMTAHGFWLGLIAFFCGFCFVLAGESFSTMLLKWRWWFVAVAVLLFVNRLLQEQMHVPGYMLAIESNFWIFSVLALGFKYLNHPGKALTYLSQAAYPVYILHMIFLFLGCLLIFPLDVDVRLQFMLVLLFTIAGCFGGYEVIRRIPIVRPLFGLGKSGKSEVRIGRSDVDEKF